MKLSELLLAELDRETPRSRRALAEVPVGKYDWKPHDRSMALGYLTQLVATMPSWIGMGITMNELDVAPASGSAMPREKLETSEALIAALDKSATEARAALQRTTDEFLMTPWKLLARGQVVQETPRWVMIQDTLNHWAHHRGQMTVYLRLVGAKVPAIYGPSADDKEFR
ncbi:MAG TPA: DinB family protein [Vicinamibacterales bacterium]|jgi:uncharacterized damage-inducible protein DinB